MPGGPHWGDLCCAGRSHHAALCHPRCCSNGRRALFLWGGLQMIAAEAVVGAIILKSTNQQDELTGSSADAISMLVAVSLFVAAFAWSW